MIQNTHVHASELKSWFQAGLGEAVLLLELQILLVESVDTINHGLDQLNLGVAQAVLVGNVVGDSVVATRLSAGSSGLKLQLFTALLQG